MAIRDQTKELAPITIEEYVEFGRSNPRNSERARSEVRISSSNGQQIEWEHVSTPKSPERIAFEALRSKRRSRTSEFQWRSRWIASENRM